MERFPLEKAQEEAKRMQEKIASSEGKDYKKAELLVEREGNPHAPEKGESEGRISQHLSDIGFNEEQASYAMERLKTVLDGYANVNFAYSLMADGLTKHTRTIFGDKEFRSFLEIIDPSQRPRAGELEAELGIDEESARRVLPPRELQEYYKEKEEFIKETLDQRKHFYKNLQSSEVFEILNSRRWRKSNEDYEPLTLPPPSRAIPTPGGGQPGYKLKHRYK